MLFYYIYIYLLWLSMVYQHDFPTSCRVSTQFPIDFLGPQEPPAAPPPQPAAKSKAAAVAAKSAACGARPKASAGGENGRGWGWMTHGREQWMPWTLIH
jgi:hypothetical protein